ncbi:helix-turn-helix domain-containing protein [Natronococcus sp.]|uniref:helix-turn-helix domain-containing protein n=1 Tax=Natronococcus sp. TaxID=35747 RepID=UPI003A4DF086
MTATSVQQPSGKTETPPLRATLEVEPDPTVGCPVVAEAPNAVAVTRTFAGDGNCHSDVVTVDDDGCDRSYVRSTATADCVCRTISRHDCVFDVTGVTDGSLVVSLVVDRRSRLARIVSALEETGATVRLRHLAHRSADERVTLEIDASDVTARQREAAKLAVELGYYDRPRNATLADLADALDVSKSAVSQRLGAVELTLIRSFVAE